MADEGEGDSRECRVCRDSEEELKTAATEYYDCLVCLCKGSVGIICRPCLNACVVEQNQRHCTGCKQIYKNITSAQKLAIVNDSWLDISMLAVVVIYIFVSALLWDHTGVNAVVVAILVWLVPRHFPNGQFAYILETGVRAIKPPEPPEPEPPQPQPS